MNFSFRFTRVTGLLFLLCLLFSASAYAGKPLITASFSGIWDQPEQESQGIILQIGETVDEEGAEQKIGIAYWFTYGPDLQTSWYLGIGDVIGNRIEMQLYTASDIGFMAENLEGNDGVFPVGSMDMEFKNCNHGMVNYEFTDGDQLLGDGDFPIKRISSIYRQRCSGGISDDTPAGGKPMQMEVHLSATDGGSGEGKGKLWERADRSDFKVEVEGILDGTYMVRICADHADPEVEVQEFEMLVTDGEGSLEFRSPEIEDKLHLNFDPRGCKVDVLDGEMVILTSGDRVLEEKQPGKPDKGDDADDGIKIEADLTNTGIIADAKGDAEFEMDSDGIEFSVKIKDVPAGLYALHINGVNHGDIEVLDDGGKFDGKIKLTDPQKEGTLELLVDPRGELVEVWQNAVENEDAVLEVLFPES